MPKLHPINIDEHICRFEVLHANRSPVHYDFLRERLRQLEKKIVKDTKYTLNTCLELIANLEEIVRVSKHPPHQVLAHGNTPAIEKKPRGTDIKRDYQISSA